MFERFGARGWTLFGTFGYSSSYVPGAQDGDELFLKDIVEPLTGDRNSARYMILCRFYCEAYTYCAADLKTRMEGSGTSSTVPKELPVVEINFRWRRLRASYPGLNFVTEKQPNHRLINTCYQMYVANVLQHVPWEICTECRDEVSCRKTEPIFKMNPAGMLVGFLQDADPQQADIGTDLKMRYALQRRGAALEMAGMMHGRFVRTIHAPTFDLWSSIANMASPVAHT